MNKLYALALLIFPFLGTGQPLDAQEAKSLLWEISGNGLDGKSYLYGTMHVADKRAFKFSKSVMPSFEQCESFAMELNPAEADPMAVLQMMRLDSGQKLQDLFDEEQWGKLDGYFQEKFKGSVAQYNDFSPFFVYSIILQSSFKKQMGQAVDLYFYNKAKEAGKELHGLETVEEQVGAINRMSDEDQVKMLMQAIDDDGKKGDKDVDALLKYYRKGDLEKLQELAEEADMGNEFESALIVERNHKMADRLQPMIKEKPTFIAVGALHLPGEEGIIELLRKEGYTVEALK